jgi:hypothetical protein
MNVKKKIRVHDVIKGIVPILILLTATMDSLANDESYPNGYLENISRENISLLCEEEFFRQVMKFNKLSCKKILAVYSNQCNKIIEPAVPSLNDERDTKVIGRIFGNLSILHFYCLKGKALDRFIEK